MRSAIVPEPARDAFPSDLSAAELASDARTAFARGDLSRASAAWLEAALRYRSAGDRNGELDALIDAAQARASLGFLDQSDALLRRARERGAEGSRRATIATLRARNHLDRGELGAAARELDEAAALASKADSVDAQAGASCTRGALLERESDFEGARRVYAQCRDLATRGGDRLLALQATAGRARAAAAMDARSESRADLAVVVAAAARMPASDTVAQLLIHVGTTYERLLEAAPPGEQADLLRDSASAYQAAERASRAVGAHRSESFALGDRARLYERRGRFEEALTLTRRAYSAAEKSGATESLFRWQWQIGQIERSLGRDAAAAESYRRALRWLERIRSVGTADTLDFEHAIEPAYIGLVDLLLLEAAATDDPERRATLLREARDWLEEFKSAELTDHFRDACITAYRKTAAEAVAGAVIVYPVLLPDRTELLVSRGTRLTSAHIDVPGPELRAEVLAFRLSLQKRTRRDYLRHAATLYDWLIPPLEAQLGESEVEALVFVPDGSLRTIPLAALYDRKAKQFLVEKYPLAVIPALTLTDPRAIERRNVRALLGGLTQSVQGYPALENVESELRQVGDILPRGNSLVDEQFVTSAVEEVLANEDYGIVHIASHGEFRSDSAQSFLLTYDGQLDMDRLAVLVERRRFGNRPIELLTLSACETAAGDERSALGLAGVAVRAGARSALATLWTVNDEAASDLIAEFYRQLAVEGVSRAEALRRAQITLLRSRPYRHPGYWAPFILVSNWM